MLIRRVFNLRTTSFMTESTSPPCFLTLCCLNKSLRWLDAGLADRDSLLGTMIDAALLVIGVVDSVKVCLELTAFRRFFSYPRFMLFLMFMSMVLLSDDEAEETEERREPIRLRTVLSLATEVKEAMSWTMMLL